MDGQTEVLLCSFSLTTEGMESCEFPVTVQQCLTLGGKKERWKSSQNMRHPPDFERLFLNSGTFLYRKLLLYIYLQTKFLHVKPLILVHYASFSISSHNLEGLIRRKKITNNWKMLWPYWYAQNCKRGNHLFSATPNEFLTCYSQREHNHLLQNYFPNIF